MRPSPPIYLTLLALLLTATTCRDSPRDNPLDPTLTPPVHLQIAAVDSLQGTAVLSWTAYAGDLPFGHYRIERRLAGQAEAEVRTTINAPQDTTFVDTEIEADHVYVYEVWIVNRGGGEAVSNAQQVSTTFVAPQILSADFSSLDASATLTWNRASSGFERYTVQRQATGDEGPATLHFTASIDDTFYVDTDLLGNTDYTYTVITRTTTGREFVSEPMSGIIYPLVGEWSWPVPDRLSMRSLTIDPADNLYIGIGSPVNFFNPTLFEVPDQIYTFTNKGELIGQFPSEPDSGVGFFGARDMAADQWGIYVLLKEPFAPADPNTISSTAMQAYVNAFDFDGTLRFRWPTEGTRPNLSDITTSLDGFIWISQAGINSSTGRHTATLFKLDAVEGTLLDTFRLDDVLLVPYFGGSMTGRGNAIVMNGTLKEDHIVVFDGETGAIRSGIFSEETGKPRVVSFDLHDRLYLLYSNDTPQISVFRNWSFLTSWALASIGSAPDWLATDTQGNIYTVSQGLDVHIFAP